MNDTESRPTTDPADDHGHLAHVMPGRVLLGVWVVLMLLTLLTVAVTRVDLGNLNIWVAMLIAVAKASLVGLYFMHLRYDSPFHAIILIAALLFVAVFVGISSLDVAQYQREMTPPPGISVPQS